MAPELRKYIWDAKEAAARALRFTAGKTLHDLLKTGLLSHIDYIEEAMVGAMVVPEETQAMIRDVFVAMDEVSECIGKAIVSDLASGAALLLAAAEGAYLNVRINAGYLTNRELADATMTRANSVREEIRRHQDAIAVAVDRKLG